MAPQQFPVPPALLTLTFALLLYFPSHTTYPPLSQPFCACLLVYAPSSPRVDTLFQALRSRGKQTSPFVTHMLLARTIPFCELVSPCPRSMTMTMMTRPRHHRFLHHSHHMPLRGSGRTHGSPRWACQPPHGATGTRLRLGALLHCPVCCVHFFSTSPQSSKTQRLASCVSISLLIILCLVFPFVPPLR
jgi:hypothetical protein